MDDLVTRLSDEIGWHVNRTGKHDFCLELVDDRDELVRIFLAALRKEDLVLTDGGHVIQYDGNREAT